MLEERNTLKDLWMNPEEYELKTFDNTWEQNVFLPASPYLVQEFNKAMKEEFNKPMIEEKPKVTVDPRKQKIRDLKNQIKLEESAITELLGSLNVEEEAKLSEEEQKKRKEEFGANFAKRKALISSLREELKQTRLNKYSSSFFSFTPHVGMNRRTARNFRRTQK